MKPKKQESSACEDLFRLRLEQMLDQCHALYRLED
jgi:IS5 family transposase